MRYENIILLSDMDGTLLDSNREVSEKNKEAIQYFIQNGGRFGIATGRSRLNAVEFLEGVKINAPCILYNGGALFDFSANEFLYEAQLPSESLVDFLNICLEKFPKVMVQVYSKDMCYLISEEALADPEVIALHRPCRFETMENVLKEKWIKILLCGENQDLKALEENLISLGIKNKVDWVFTSEIFLEILPEGVSKGSTLDIYRDILGRRPKIYVVGDHNNDIEMLSAADVGIAVGNALPAVREAADYICAGNDENAIEDVVYRIILAEGYLTERK